MLLSSFISRFIPAFIPFFFLSFLSFALFSLLLSSSFNDASSVSFSFPSFAILLLQRLHFAPRHLVGYSRFLHPSISPPPSRFIRDFKPSLPLTITLPLLPSRHLSICLSVSLSASFSFCRSLFLCLSVCFCPLYISN